MLDPFEIAARHRASAKAHGEQVSTFAFYSLSALKHVVGQFRNENDHYPRPALPTLYRYPLVPDLRFYD